VQALYANVVPKPREECSKAEQLGVSFAAGYIAGVLCAVVSHPADNLVSKLNANKAATISSVVADMGYYNLFTRGLPLRVAMARGPMRLQERPERGG
jgi:solute carrier family 25 (mitochondrial phosphate transporter), member 3